MPHAPISTDALTSLHRASEPPSTTPTHAVAAARVAGPVVSGGRGPGAGRCAHLRVRCRTLAVHGLAVELFVPDYYCGLCEPEPASLDDVTVCYGLDGAPVGPTLCSGTRYRTACHPETDVKDPDCPA